MLQMKFLHSLSHRISTFPALGVDFSDLSIKFIRFDPSESKLRVHYLGSAPLPEGAMVNGVIEKTDEIVSVLRNLKTEGGRTVRERFVVASLPEEKGFIQMLKIANIKRDNMNAAIRWELESVVPLPAEDIYFDYEVLPSQVISDHTDVLVLAYPRILVDAYTAVIKRAGMIPIAMELESQAIVRALISPSNLRPMLIVDLGATRTSFVLVENGNIIHTSTISISGQMFEDSIAKALNISKEEARDLKVSVGLDQKKENGAVASALMDSLQLLKEEITRHVEYYHNHAKDRAIADTAIERIVLTGGDANLIGLDSYISRGLKIQVEHWNPFSLVLPRMGSVLPPIQANAAHAYTTAIGLALRNII